LAYERSRVRGDHTFLVLGDLFDTSDPIPQMVAAVQSALPGRGPRVILLRGNHDMVSTASGDHALGAFAEEVQIIEAPEQVHVPGVGLVLVLIPFMPGDAREWLPAALASLGPLEGDQRLLCIHAGIIDAQTPHFLRHAHDAVPLEQVVSLAKKYGIRQVWAGNWHSRRIWNVDGVQVVQVGALCPTGWDNPGFEYGTLMHWEDGKVSHEIIPGPRFVKVATSGDLRNALTKRSLLGANRDKLYVRVVADAGNPEAVAQARTLVDVLTEDGDAAELELEQTKVQAQAAKAARAARATDTLEEALDAYVRTMPPCAGPTPDEIIAKAREYLKL
jgi:hypothetical protein